MFLFKPIRSHRLLDKNKRNVFVFEFFCLVNRKFDSEIFNYEWIGIPGRMSLIKCWCLMWWEKKKVSLRQVRDQLNMTTIISRLWLSLLLYLQLVKSHNTVWYQDKLQHFAGPWHYMLVPWFRNHISTYHINMKTLFIKLILILKRLGPMPRQVFYIYVRQIPEPRVWQ